MQLARIRYGSRTDFAIRNVDGQWVPLATLGVDAPDTAAAILQSRTAEARVRAGLGVPLADEPRLTCPIVRPGKVLAIGLNYLDHIRETGAQQPELPVVFAKYSNALNGPTDPIVLDRDLTEQLDYESELAVVIGSSGRNVAVDDVHQLIFGYAVANDVSARDWQKRDAQFSRSKSYDTFCPVGPWITTADEVADPQNLRITSSVNGETRQDSTTAEMIFNVSYLLAYLSKTMTLEPGDVVLTGTPHGVGLGMRPPRFLAVDDVVRCEVEGLGAIENRIVGGS